MTLRNRKNQLTLLQLGSQCLAAKRYAEAIDLFLNHVEAEPQDAAKAYAKIAECYKRTNILPAPELHASGVTLVSKGNRQSAEFYYRLALADDSKHFSSIKGLAELLPENSEERCRLLETAVSIQPGSLVLIDLADYYRTHRKDLDKAYELYRKAQEHAPKDETAYRRLQDLCRRLDRSDEARDWGEMWRQVKSKKRSW